MKFYRLLAAFLVIFLSFQLAAFAADNGNGGFNDVSDNFWASDAINSMAERGIISGQPDGSFKPNDPITREQFAKLLTMTLGLEAETTDSPTFSDVPASAWSYVYIEAAKDYMTGYFPRKGKPFFDPRAKATREDVAVALVKAIGLNDEEINGIQVLQNKFQDYEAVSPQLVNEVAAAVQNKLISGFPDGTFRPESAIDRASVASLLYRVLKSSYSEATKDIELKVSIPATTATPTITVSGTVTKGAKLTVNGEEIPVDNGKFEEKLYLEQGEKTYDFEFKAALANGRARTETKTVVYQVTGPELTVKVPETSNKPSVKISGKVNDPSDTNVTVTVNDKDVYVSYNGEWTTDLTLKEGVNEITVTAENKAGKQTVVNKQVTYTPGAPELILDLIPETTSTQTITLSGRAKDDNDPNPKVYINDQYVDYSYFSKSFTLKEGENVFRFKAVNSSGKASEVVSRTVIFKVDGPVLQLDNIPEVTTSKTITLSGHATDANDSGPKVYINDQYVDYSYFSKSYTLKEGDNVFTFKAVNKLGKSSEMITKTVKFNVGGPTITLDNVPETTTSKSITLSGRATDANDSNPKVYINDQYVDYSYFSKTYTLKEGENIFTIKAVNNLGKTSEVITKTVVFSVPAPELTVDLVPETTTSVSLTISGRAMDANDPNPKVYINNVYVDSNYFSKTYTLTAGENVFVIKAINSLGKVSEVVTKTVTYTTAP